MKKENQNKISLMIGLIILALLLPKKSMAGTFFDFGLNDIKEAFSITGMLLKMTWWIWLPIVIVRIILYWLDKRRGEKKDDLNVNLKVKGNLADLEKLSELRSKNIITEEEFQKKKKEILG